MTDGMEWGHSNDNVHVVLELKMSSVLVPNNDSGNGMETQWQELKKKNGME